MIKRNVFDRVSRENEDSTTELLANIMSVNYVKDYIFKAMGIDSSIYELIKAKDITTQYSLDNVARPDIVIKNDKILMYIENKIHKETDLQPTQTTTYLDELLKSNKENKYMIYLIPEGYKHENELKDVISKNNFCRIWGKE